MNERIRELANEAGLLVHNPNGVPTKLEKFAELLIRECALQCFHNEDMDRIEKHFGVEA